MNHYENPNQRDGYRENITDPNREHVSNDRNAPVIPNQPTAATHAEGYTKIPPNESRRNQLLRISQAEEEDLRRWREENYPGPIQLTPERLGGAVSLEEVRQRQWLEARHSKQMKKLRKEDMDRAKRQAEEEKYEKMKAKQREEANKLELKRKQEEARRTKQFQQHNQRKTEQFLQRFEGFCSVPMPTSSSIPASSWAKSHEYRESRRAEEKANVLKKQEEQRRKAEILEKKQKQQEEDRKRETKADHRRVNSAFLDRLEASASGRMPHPEAQTRESSDVWQDDDEPHRPGFSASRLDSEEGDESDPLWTLMKLQNHFPNYEREVLEDILEQCNCNFQEAFDLLYI